MNSEGSKVLSGEGAEVSAEVFGDVKTEDDGVCSECRGTDGHHFLNCESKGEVDEPPTLEEEISSMAEKHGSIRESAGGGAQKPTIAELEKQIDAGEDVHLDTDGTVEESSVADNRASVLGEAREDFDEQKVPPTDDDVASTDFLWLMAKLCHEVNRVYCQSIGDHSQSKWDEASVHQRRSVFNGVTMHFENPEATQQDSHNSWLAEKEADGWTYGEVKDEVAKTHPCMLPYGKLPMHQQYKDKYFVTICKTMFGG